jgi:hypothetical protein
MAADQATGGKTASEAGKPQVFRSPTAVVVWVVWLLFAVGNLTDLAIQGNDHTSLIAAGILVMGTGVAYVAAQRPRVIAEDDRLIVRNPLKDHRLPWGSIARVDVSDLLRVHCKPPGQAGVGAGQVDTGQGKAGKAKVITAWAVHYSRRRQYSADVKLRRDAMRAAGPRPRRLGGTSQFGIPQSKNSQQSRNNQPGAYGAPQQEAEALKVVRLLNDRIDAARIEQATERDTDQGTILASYNSQQRNPQAPTSSWSPRAIVALLVPAIILLVVCLL